jgi:long-chain acyl-CoA synthetase
MAGSQSPDPMAPSPSTITEHFLAVVEEYPDNLLFHYHRDGWRTLTYREFSARVRAVATFLAASGIGKGDRVGIVSENRPEWCEAYLAVVTAGGVAVPLDAQLGPEEIKTLASDAEAKMIFLSGKTLDSATKAQEKMAGDHGRSVSLLNFDSPEYEEVLHTKPLEEFPATAAGDLASIIYTSGTTGNPKGVMLLHRNFCSDAEALRAGGIVTHEDSVLAVLPLHHTYAFMCTFLVPLFLGASIIYPASLKGPDLLSAVKDRGATVMIGVPQLLTLMRNGIMNKIRGLPGPVSLALLNLMRLSGFLRERYRVNPGRLLFRSVHEMFGRGFRFFGSGGARLDPTVMKDMEALGFTVLEGYGLTETSPVITFNPVEKRKPGSVGRPLPSVEIRILDPSETGEGEIAVRGPMVMKGYYKKPSATADVMRDQWFKTGDIGRIDNEGYLFITGRSKEVIVLSSGKNIYPEDVEKMYTSSPIIGEICILGAERNGVTEGLHAVIVPDLEYAKRSGISNVHEELKWAINEISGKIPSYMRITGFSIRKEPLPRTPLGKVRRFLVKAETAGTPETEKRVREEESVAYTDETAGKVIDALRQFAKEQRHIRQDDNIELDLGLDSLSKIELTAALEKAFSLKLPEDFMSGIQTVGELTEKIRKQSATESPGGMQERTGWREILSAGLSENDLRAVSLEGPERSMVPTFLAFTVLKIVFKLFFRLEARDLGNIPVGGNYILAANHSSYLDGPSLILSLPFSRFRQIYSLGLRDFFTGFLKGGFAKLAHVIPIDSSSYLSKALQMSAHVLRHGRSLAVFPEGGRSFDGNLMEFKKGVGILAVEMGVPVIPVRIRGAFEALPRGVAFPKFRKISVTFGKPLRFADMDFSKKRAGVDEYQHFADTVKERVRELGR